MAVKNASEVRQLFGLQSILRGHLLVRRGDKTSTLPQHGGRKQLGVGLWNKILKDLGLKET